MTFPSNSGLLSCNHWNRFDAGSKPPPPQLMRRPIPMMLANCGFLRALGCCKMNLGLTTHVEPTWLFLFAPFGISDWEAAVSELGTSTYESRWATQRLFNSPYRYREGWRE